MSQIQQQIRDTIEQITGLDRVRQRYNAAVHELNGYQKELDKLHAVMVKELKDLDEIESKGLKPFFYKVLGSKEQQIEKERQEYLSASLKFNERQKSVEVLEFEVELLNKKLGDTTQLKKNLETLKAKRENEILRQHPDLANKLLQIAKEKDQKFKYLKELEDVLEVGNKCIKSLNEMVNELKKARQWGQWDMTTKRGNYAGYNKHGAIDRAKNISVWVKHELIKLNKELADVGHSKQNFQLNIANFSQFTDIFFDNLISDWVIQKKIVNALSNTVSVRDRILLIVKTVRNEVEKVNQSVTEANARREQIILSS